VLSDGNTPLSLTKTFSDIVILDDFDAVRRELASCKPGAIVIHAAIVPNINNKAYIMRVLVLLRQED
ncbi:hypothetical protein V1478_016835, partial [Vespula squamosa]